MLHTLFFLQNAVYFIMLSFLVPVLFTFYIQDVLNLNVKLRCQKVKRENEQWGSYGDKDTGRTYKTRFDSRHGKNLNIFSKASRPAMGPKTVSY
jgi:hypothetical protein